MLEKSNGIYKKCFVNNNRKCSLLATIFWVNNQSQEFFNNIQICTIIYLAIFCEQSLTMSRDARKETPTGEIINLMSLDTLRIVGMVM